MSKSKGNIVDPWDHFNREGADATRWYMVTAGAPWNPLKFDPNGVRETYAKMFLTLWNCYKFHADYAALDNFDPDANECPVGSRPSLDRWILSKLNSVASEYHAQFEGWDFHKACRDLEEFVVNDLSNWYVRRSRRRLWDEADSSDKLACQHTLHDVLTTLCRLIAPVSPFMVDVIHRNLTGESVHLADWPTPQHQDTELESRMQLVRNLAEAGRKVRVDNDHRQRLPCQTGWLVGAKGIDEFYPILAEEINVLDLQTENDLDRFQRIEVSPNRKTLGRKCRQDLPKVMAALAEADPDALWDDIQNGRCVIAGFELEPIDVEVKRVEREGFAAMTAEDSDVTLVLDMTITDTLLSMGLAREIIRRVQQKRKELDLDVDATISLNVWLDEGNPELLGGDWDHIVSEVRAKTAILDQGGQASEDADSFDVDGIGIHFRVD